MTPRDLEAGFGLREPKVWQFAECQTAIRISTRSSGFGPSKIGAGSSPCRSQPIHIDVGKRRNAFFYACAYYLLGATAQERPVLGCNSFGLICANQGDVYQVFGQKPHLELICSDHVGDN
jgi:hypothetical protein